MLRWTKKHCWSSQTLAQWKGRVWCAVMKHSVHDISYEMQSSHWTSRFLVLLQEQVLEATGFASQSRMCWVRRGMIFMNASKSTDIWLFGSVNYRGLHKMKPTCVFFLGGASSGLVEVVSACGVFSAGWGIEPSAEHWTWTQVGKWGQEYEGFCLDSSVGNDGVSRKTGLFLCVSCGLVLQFSKRCISFLQVRVFGWH